MHPRVRRTLKTLGVILIIWGILYIGLVLTFRPSHERTWELGQETLPRIHVDEHDTVTINGFRNFDWQSSSTANVHYETRSFSLNDINSVDVYISHFDDFEGLAHIFVSFGRTDGEHVVVSFESRREVGEKFSPTLGLLRQFEIIYVVGSEEDIVGLRTDLRNERVYLYPTHASKEQAAALFRLLAEDINAVYAEPRTYNTLTRNCTNEITRRVEDIVDIRFPFTWKTVLPGYFDEVLYDMHIISTDGSFADTKKQHRIDNTRVDRHNATYSADLRRDIMTE